MKLLIENWRKHLKEESTLPTEGSDQKKWFTVKGKRDGYMGSGGWIEIATVELPESFTNKDRLENFSLTEEGLAYFREKVPSFDPEQGKSLIIPSVEPNVIPWEGAAPADTAPPTDPEADTGRTASDEEALAAFGAGN